MKLKRYKKEDDISICLGVFPTIELLEKKPEKVAGVLLNTEGKKNTGVEKIIKICEAKNIPYEYNDRQISMYAYKENTYAVSVFSKYEAKINLGLDHLVLVNPKNMGNLGTMIRTMVAFGVYDLAMIRPAADIFDPKVVASAMGAFFQIRFEYFESLDEYISAVDPERKLYSFVVRDALDIDKVEFASPSSLVFGNEGAGLTEADANKGIRVTIPQKGDVDSLNLSMAVGIGLYELKKE